MKDYIDFMFNRADYLVTAISALLFALFVLLAVIPLIGFFIVWDLPADEWILPTIGRFSILCFAWFAFVYWLYRKEERK